MPKFVKEIIESQGLDSEKYNFIEKTADNITLTCKKSNKKVNIRW